MIVEPSSQFWLCYDVDDTVFEYGYYIFCKWGPPLKGIRDHLQKMKQMDRKILLFTSRSDVEYDALIEHLRYHDLLQFVDRIQFGKPVCEIYVDDRAVLHDKDWSTTSKRIEELLKRKGRNI